MFPEHTRLVVMRLATVPAGIVRCYADGLKNWTMPGARDSVGYQITPLIGGFNHNSFLLCFSRSAAVL